MGVDSRHADQQVRGAVVLPNGTGKSVRVSGNLPRATAAKAARSGRRRVCRRRRDGAARSRAKAGWILTC
ncbi:MAG: hypothetical protein ACLVEX_04355 [Ruthenibacterium lactatiformans]